MVDTEKTVVLKTVADLTNDHTRFYIDSFQRGYRWTDEQVKELIQDIYEFSQKHLDGEKSFYCLQPIIISFSSEGEAWKVIDGQQRLTTLYLLISYLKGTHPRNPMPYEIVYNNKPRLSECLTMISEYAINGTWNEDIYNELKTCYGEDIDCYYVVEAYNTITKEMNILFPEHEANQIKNLSKFNYSVFDDTKVIWYDLNAQSLEDEISSFRKVNMGKIPLTNAELIKALLLKTDETESDTITNYKKNLAVFWDGIEQQLADNRFWSFLTNSSKDEYPNRIDFIFDVISVIINEEWKKSDSSKGNKISINRLINKSYFSFHVFYRYIEQIERDGSNSYVQVIWNEVEEYFRMFKDWYKEKEWYHRIGYLICAGGDRYLEIVCQISRIYRGEKSGKKSTFSEKLRDMMADSIGKDGNKSNKIKTVEDLQAYLSDENFTYIRKAKDIERVLLLYNIATMDKIKNEYSRFPFYAFKGNGIQWSIEHINPQHEDKPQNDKERVEWLSNLYESRDEIVPNYTRDLAEVEKLKNKISDLKEMVDTKQEISADEFSRLYERVIESLDENHGADHSICNLVLLDRDTNSLFSNSIFPVKRRLLIEAYKNGDVFIPVCTRNVFFKAFPESKELLKWSKNDKEEYFSNIVNMISGYLHLQEA